MKTILLFVPDLMFGSRIEGVARKLGYCTMNLDAQADFDLEIERTKPELVVTTFDHNTDAWESVIVSAHAANVRALAFGSHLNVDAFKLARELGADQVVANSRMNSELPALLQKWVGTP